MLRNGEMEDKDIEIAVADTSPSPQSARSICLACRLGRLINLGDMMRGMMGGKQTQKKLKRLRRAGRFWNGKRRISWWIPNGSPRTRWTMRKTTVSFFLDEIDKVCARTSEGGFRGGDVSREGVQRDLLPLIEGTTVSTKYGPVKTDHILFIASGAFHLAKPADLLPELQGRLPIRVELSPLTRVRSAPHPDRARA